uniref:Uncharacterized protein n=1 Tax=virus sp. ctBM815 TaxID=2825806 RepID=A0A8S5RKM4_9VIRU|nr:MAG TPA: hypothetical protein [virus sp. ctBM815]
MFWMKVEVKRSWMDIYRINFLPVFCYLLF